MADRSDGRILGAHVMGYEASILIQVVTMAMPGGFGAGGAEDEARRGVRGTDLSSAFAGFRSR